VVVVVISTTTTRRRISSSSGGDGGGGRRRRRRSSNALRRRLGLLSVVPKYPRFIMSNDVGDVLEMNWWSSLGCSRSSVQIAMQYSF
jgi:hypothetical protein